MIVRWKNIRSIIDKKEARSRTSVPPKNMVSLPQKSIKKPQTKADIYIAFKQQIGRNEIICITKAHISTIRF